ncbi:MAG: glycosyltransferase family 4 protein [Gammaproteobacteria bacterium]|nr:glycosyltransferase family 4 protein [Gammaproteobacteria bacterium]
MITWLWLAFGISWLWAWILSRWAPDVLLDIPTYRSLHSRPVPRGGGIGIVLGVWGACLAAPIKVQCTLVNALFLLLIFGSVLALFSFIDDIRSLSPLIRLIVHFILSALWLSYADIAGIRVIPGGDWDWPAELSFAFNLLTMAWMVNLYNFMDGMDGLAAGMGVIGFGTLAWLGYQQGATMEYILLATSISAASLGFLLVNFPPARLFMGDVGSTFLGFMAAGLILYADKHYLFPAWIGGMPFLPFIVDATVTLLKRIWRKERVWKPHKSHYFQRLVQSGWGHRRTLIVEVILMLYSSLMAVILLHQDVIMQRLGFFSVLLSYLVVVLYLEYYLSNREHS